MRRRETIQLFSTASIDLLACGLGGMLVLWLLVFGNQGGAAGDKPLASGEIRIRQFGHAHLLHFKVPDDYYLASLNMTENGNNVLVTTTEKDLLKVDQVNLKKICYYLGGKNRNFEANYRKADSTEELTISCRASAGFALEFTVRFDKMPGAEDVELGIEGCKDALDVHYLTVDSIDSRGVESTRYVFHCKDQAVEALGKQFPASFGKYENRYKAIHKEAIELDDIQWLFSFRDALRVELATMCPEDGWKSKLFYRVYNCSVQRNLTFDVMFSGDGAVRLEEPPATVAPTLEYSVSSEALATWSGASFRTSPACP